MYCQKKINIQPFKTKFAEKLDACAYKYYKAKRK